MKRWYSSSLLTVVLATLACERAPTAGARCNNLGRYICGDASTALYCNAGTYLAIPCRGPRGCIANDVTPVCDDDLAHLGDACMGPPTAPGNYACAIDRRSAFVCEGGTFRLWRNCKGPKTCAVSPSGVSCDNSVGDVGDPCGTQGTAVCSTDHKMLLSCEGEKLVAANACRGPKECQLLPDKNVNHCDDSMASEGDPCDLPDEPSCAIDGKFELVCKSGKYAVKRACARDGGCVVKGRELFCAF